MIFNNETARTPESNEPMAQSELQSLFEAIQTEPESIALARENVETAEKKMMQITEKIYLRGMNFSLFSEQLSQLNEAAKNRGPLSIEEYGGQMNALVMPRDAYLSGISPSRPPSVSFSEMAKSFPGIEHMGYAALKNWIKTEAAQLADQSSITHRWNGDRPITQKAFHLDLAALDSYWNGKERNPWRALLEAREEHSIAEKEYAQAIKDVFAKDAAREQQLLPSVMACAELFSIDPDQNINKAWCQWYRYYMQDREVYAEAVKSSTEMAQKMPQKQIQHDSFRAPYFFRVPTEAARFSKILGKDKKALSTIYSKIIEGDPNCVPDGYEGNYENMIQIVEQHLLDFAPLKKQYEAWLQNLEFLGDLVKTIFPIRCLLQLAQGKMPSWSDLLQDLVSAGVWSVAIKGGKMLRFLYEVDMGRKSATAAQIATAQKWVQGTAIMGTTGAIFAGKNAVQYAKKGEYFEASVMGVLAIMGRNTPKYIKGYTPKGHAPKSDIRADVAIDVPTASSSGPTKSSSPRKVFPDPNIGAPGAAKTYAGTTPNSTNGTPPGPTFSATSNAPNGTTTPPIISNSTRGSAATQQMEFLHVQPYSKGVPKTEAQVGEWVNENHSAWARAALPDRNMRQREILSRAKMKQQFRSLEPLFGALFAIPAAEASESIEPLFYQLMLSPKAQEVIIKELKKNPEKGALLAKYPDILLFELEHILADDLTGIEHLLANPSAAAEMRLEQFLGTSLSVLANKFIASFHSSIDGLEPIITENDLTETLKKAAQGAQVIRPQELLDQWNSTWEALQELIATSPELAQVLMRPEMLLQLLLNPSLIGIIQHNEVIRDMLKLNPHRVLDLLQRQQVSLQQLLENPALAMTSSEVFIAGTNAETNTKNRNQENKEDISAEDAVLQQLEQLKKKYPKGVDIPNEAMGAISLDKDNPNSLLLEQLEILERIDPRAFPVSIVQMIETRPDLDYHFIVVEGIIIATVFTQAPGKGFTDETVYSVSERGEKQSIGSRNKLVSESAVFVSEHFNQHDTGAYVLFRVGEMLEKKGIRLASSFLNSATVAWKIMHDFDASIFIHQKDAHGNPMQVMKSHNEYQEVLLNQLLNGLVESYPEGQPILWEDIALVNNNTEASRFEIKAHHDAFADADDPAIRTFDFGTDIYTDFVAPHMQTPHGVSMAHIDEVPVALLVLKGETSLPSYLEKGQSLMTNDGPIDAAKLRPLEWINVWERLENRKLAAQFLIHKNAEIAADLGQRICSDYTLETSKDFNFFVEKDVFIGAKEVWESLAKRGYAEVLQDVQTGKPLVNKSSNDPMYVMKSPEEYPTDDSLLSTFSEQERTSLKALKDTTRDITDADVKVLKNIVKKGIAPYKTDLYIRTYLVQLAAQEESAGGIIRAGKKELKPFNPLELSLLLEKQQQNQLASIVVTSDYSKQIEYRILRDYTLPSMLEHMRNKQGIPKRFEQLKSLGESSEEWQAVIHYFNTSEEASDAAMSHLTQSIETAIDNWANDVIVGPNADKTMQEMAHLYAGVVATKTRPHGTTSFKSVDAITKAGAGTAMNQFWALLKQHSTVHRPRSMHSMPGYLSQSASFELSSIDYLTQLLAESNASTTLLLQVGDKPLAEDQAITNEKGSLSATGTEILSEKFRKHTQKEFAYGCPAMPNMKEFYALLWDLVLQKEAANIWQNMETPLKAQTTKEASYRKDTLNEGFDQQQLKKELISCREAIEKQEQYHAEIPYFLKGQPIAISHKPDTGKTRIVIGSAPGIAVLEHGPFDLDTRTITDVVGMTINGPNKRDTDIYQIFQLVQSEVFGTRETEYITNPIEAKFHMEQNFLPSHILGATPNADKALSVLEQEGAINDLMLFFTLQPDVQLQEVYKMRPANLKNVEDYTLVNIARERLKMPLLTESKDTPPNIYAFLDLPYYIDTPTLESAYREKRDALTSQSVQSILRLAYEIHQERTAFAADANPNEIIGQHSNLLVPNPRIKIKENGYMERSIEGPVITDANGYEWHRIIKSVPEQVFAVGLIRHPAIMNVADIQYVSTIFDPTINQVNPRYDGYYSRVEKAINQNDEKLHGIKEHSRGIEALAEITMVYFLLNDYDHNPSIPHNYAINSAHNFKYIFDFDRSKFGQKDDIVKYAAQQFADIIEGHSLTKQEEIYVIMALKLQVNAIKQHWFGEENKAVDVSAMKAYLLGDESKAGACSQALKTFNSFTESLFNKSQLLKDLDVSLQTQKKKAIRQELLLRLIHVQELIDGYNK